MPIGKHVSEEEKTNILRLKAQGLTGKVISIRTGLCLDTIRRIAKEGGAHENSERT